MNASPVRLGVAGLGRGFVLTLPALKASPSIVLAGAFDVRGEATRRFAQDFGARAYGSFDALIADGEIDALYIATPHGLHAAQVVAAAKAGKHVLVEKPMAISLVDCRAMVEAADVAGTVLMVGPSHGFDVPVQAAAELVASGDYGAVRMVTALNFTDFMYRPRRPEELDTSLGGGVVYSQAAHQIDLVRRLVGRPVRTVRAITGNWDASRPSEGAYAAMLAFAGGVVASLTYSGYAHYDSDELVGWISELGHEKDSERYGDARRALAGMAPELESQAKLSRTFDGAKAHDGGSAPHHEHFGFVLVSCERGDLKLTPRGVWVYGDNRRHLVPLAQRGAARSSVVEAFVAAIRGGQVGLHDGRWGLATMACCIALLRSSEEGREIALSDLMNPQGDTGQ